MKKIKITEGFSLSNKLDIKFILGPCQIESASHAFEVCDEISKLSKCLRFYNKKSPLRWSFSLQ